MQLSLVWIIPSGYISGILINYLTDILPVDFKFALPVCRNSACNRPITWPRYFLLQSCEKCDHKYSLRHYLVVITSIIILYYLNNNPIPALGIFGSYILFQYLFLVGLIDFEHRLILRPLSLLGLFAGLIIGLFSRNWQSTLLGGVAGFGIMLIFYYFGVLFTKFRNKRLGTSTDGEESLGSGDVTLAAILGLILGWPLIWFNLFSGILLAGALSLILVAILLITRKYRSMMVYIAYGPFFITSAIIMLFFPRLISSFLPGL
ncbi:prepilin peptidase [Chloroflexota bacterium]